MENDPNLKETNLGDIPIFHFYVWKTKPFRMRRFKTPRFVNFLGEAAKPKIDHKLVNHGLRTAILLQIEGNKTRGWYFWKNIHQVIQAMTFLSPIWRSPTTFEGVTLFTIPKSAQRITKNFSYLKWQYWTLRGYFFGGGVLPYKTPYPYILCGVRIPPF